MHCRRGRKTPQTRVRPWKVESRSVSFRAAPYVTVWRERVALPSGRVLPDFFTLELPEYAIVVVRTHDRRYLIAKQYRHGVGHVTLGFPAGFLGPGETPLRAARRELLEEAGLAAASWKRLGAFVVDGNRGSGRAHIFLAQRFAPKAAPAEDDTEQLTFQYVRESRLQAMVKAGRLPVAAHALAFWLAREEAV